HSSAPATRPLRAHPRPPIGERKRARKTGGGFLGPAAEGGAAQACSSASTQSGNHVARSNAPIRDRPTLNRTSLVRFSLNRLAALPTWNLLRTTNVRYRRGKENGWLKRPASGLDAGIHTIDGAGFYVLLAAWLH